MPRSDLVEHVKEHMGGWNGEGRKGPPPPNGVGPITQWVYAMEQWGFKVRRDILVIEKLLIPDDEVRQRELYGDPGDPPIDPDLL